MLQRILFVAVLVIAALCLLAISARAVASKVTYRVNGSGPRSFTTFSYVADPGERNVVTAYYRRRASSMASRGYTLTDLGARGIRVVRPAGDVWAASCMRPQPLRITCSRLAVSSGHPLTAAGSGVSVGDGDDVVRVIGAPSSAGWKLNGAGGNDVLRGSAGQDQVVGGEGDDRLFPAAGFDPLIDSGPGSDFVDTRDGIPESLYCGAGADTAWIDRSDRPRLCEQVRRS